LNQYKQREELANVLMDMEELMMERGVSLRMYNVMNNQIIHYVMEREEGKAIYCPNDWILVKDAYVETCKPE
jgi:hypothetical protein